MEVGESYEIARQDTSEEILEKIKGGVAPSNVKRFSVTLESDHAKVRLEEPQDTEVDGFTLCTVKGCVVLMNTEHTPQNETDGTVICETKQGTSEYLGKYKDTDLEFEYDFAADTTYYFAAFPYSDQLLYNRNSKNALEVTRQNYKLYGMKINKTDSNPATRIEYTEMAENFKAAKMDYDKGVFDYGDWENVWFVLGNKPYMIKDSGAVDYQLNPNNYNEKVDGTASQVSDTAYAGNAMASIPLIWVKRWEDSTHQYVNFCDIQLDTDYKAYAHTRADGSVASVKYLRMFEGSGSTDKMRSLSGKTPLVSTTAEQEVTAAAANGAQWNVNSWSEWHLIDDMLKMISRNDNCQVAFGYGRGGATSAMNTGSLNGKGQFYGTSEDQSKVSAVKVFHMENWWGNVWNRIAGCVNVDGIIKLKPYPPYNLTGSGFVNTNLTPSGTSGGYISGDKMTEYGRVGYVYSGSGTTYACDGGWFNNSGTMVALVGGDWHNAAICGSGCLLLNNPATDAYTYFGACLSCEQPTA